MPKGWSPCTTCADLAPPGKSQCLNCIRATDKARGTSTQRGYGQAHQALRRQWQTRITQAPTPCARCGKPITKHDEWHLDHDDNDRTKYLGPSCATCNLSAGGRKGAAITNAPDDGYA